MEKVNRCECLDFVGASYRHKVYPVMYCRMKIIGHLDMDRLKIALLQIETELQKSRYRCFAGIKVLNYMFRTVPLPLLGQMIKAVYRLLPVSYTNIGRVDDKKLFFNDCCIKSRYMTGGYRMPPFSFSKNGIRRKY